MFSPNAKDLIDKLLQLSPEFRLGAGKEGSQQSFDELKNHPFFINVLTDDEKKKYKEDPVKHRPDLNKLYTKKVPLSFEPAAMYVTKDFKIKLENKFKAA